MIGLLGFDHQRASADHRGRVSFTGEQLLDSLRYLTRVPAIAEAVVLSTCNRTEVYVATDDWAAARAAVQHFLGMTYHCRAGDAVATAGLGARADALAVRSATVPARQPALARSTPHPGLPTELVHALYALDELDAVQHLLRVAAGLESMVVGEAQILGQVKDALAAAEVAGTAGEELRAAFTQAIKAGKRVRTETEIGRADTSVAALAVRVAHEALGGLGGKSALIIGAGRTSQLCAKLLRARGVGRILLANRSHAAAATVARAVVAEVVALSDVPAVLGDTQLVISATAAPYVILSAAMVAAGLGRRRAPLVIIDLAVPPDVEEAAGLLPPVSLYTLDSLRAMDAMDTADGAAMDTHAADLANAEAILGETIREYMRSRTLRRMGPGIAALRAHVDRSEQAELERALAQLEHLSAEDRAVVTRLGRRLVDKMFHHLVSRVRALAEYDEVPPEVTLRVLGRLFADPGAAPDRDDSHG